MSRNIIAADLFCGAGGTSTGLYLAAKEIGVGVDLLAVNHWKVAIKTHTENHKLARHLCETLDGVNPREVVPGGRLDLLVASPECTHHSNARGGRPMSDQSRASGWHVVRWAEALSPKVIIIENVREFKTWGPLGANGRPMKSRRGETYQAWLAAIRSLGYVVDDRILNAADYGDPTTRMRLFVVAKRGRRPFAWPVPTHSKDGSPTLFGKTQKWRAAREIIDWSDAGTSIFNRKKSLSPNTIRRIAVGLRKFSGLDLEPFFVKLYGTSTAASVNGPVPTVTGSGQHIGVAKPFIVPQNSSNEPRDIERPAPVLTTTSRGVGLAQPFLIGQQSEAAPRSTEEPAPTVASKGAIAKVEPFLVAHFGEREGQEPRTHSMEDPAPTVTQRGAGDLVQPFITEFHGGPGGDKRVKSTEDPLPTQNTEPRFGLAQPFMMGAGGPSGAGKPASIDEPLGTVLGENHRAVIIPVTHSPKPGEDAGRRTHSVDEPLPTVTTAKRGELALAQQSFILPKRGRYGNNQPRSVDEPVQTVVPHHGAGYVVSASLVQYNGTADAKSLDQPIGALSGKPRYALMIVYQNGERHLLDVFFRMLKPRELARAQSFPDDYQFSGKTEDVVKQIGNAVPVKLAKALCLAAIA